MDAEQYEKCYEALEVKRDALADAAQIAEYAIRVWDVDRDALSEEGLMKAHKHLVNALKTSCA